jgi:hypothetical protein
MTLQYPIPTDEKAGQAFPKCAACQVLQSTCDRWEEKLGLKIYMCGEQKGLVGVIDLLMYIVF